MLSVPKTFSTLELTLNDGSRFTVSRSPARASLSKGKMRNRGLASSVALISSFSVMVPLSVCCARASGLVVVKIPLKVNTLSALKLLL